MVTDLTARVLPVQSTGEGDEGVGCLREKRRRTHRNASLIHFRCGGNIDPQHTKKRFSGRLEAIEG